MNADVAVIVRTKDRPLLLRRALSSIHAQTATPRQLIVVNDGGDRTAVEAALEPFRDSIAEEVRVVHHDLPVGRPRGMNVGVRASDAAAFVFHDDDDSWHPTFLQATTAHLQAHRDDVAVATRTAVVWERIEGEEIVELSREVYQASTASVTLTETLYGNATPPICLVYRRDAYDDVGGYDDRLTALADWDFLIRVLGRSTVGFIDGEPLAHWHHRRDDSSETGNSAYADADAHRAFNRSIRDDYLRRGLAGRDDLGTVLFVADGFRRIDEKADAARAEAARIAQERAAASRDHLEVVHASLAQEVAATREVAERLAQQVADLQELVRRRASSTVSARLARGVRAGIERVRTGRVGG